MRQLQSGGGKAMSFGKSRAKMLNESTRKVTFDDVAGCDEAKEELADILQFLKEPPKSTGRELFGRADLDRRLSDLGARPQEDVIATLTGFTAALVAQDLDRLQQRTGVRPLELVVAGGGRHNRTLMKELRRRCHGVALRDSDALNIPAEAREALVFALLAWWHHHRYPGNAPAVTGASRPAVLGISAEPSGFKAF